MLDNDTYMSEKSTLTIKLALFTFVISFVIFFGIFYLKIPTDLQDHVYGLTLILKNHSFPIPPLYYFLLYLFSGFSADIGALSNVAIVILSLAVALKYYYSVDLIAGFYPNKKIDPLLNVAIWLFIFSAPIVYNYKQMLFGRIATNFWHNSTTILLMPFALLLLSHSIKFLQLKQPEIKNVISIVFLGIINLLIKPSFLFPFIPTFLIMVGLTSGLRSQLFKTAFYIALTLGALIFLEYYSIYKMTVIDAVRFKNDAKGLTIKPFYTFLMFSDGSWAVMLLNFLAGLLFPVFCCLFFFKDILKEKGLIYVGILFLIAFLIGTLITEQGIMASNGNFLWQLHISNYILFLFLIKFIYDKFIQNSKIDKRILLLIITFSIHVLSGFLYLAKIFYLRKYS